MHSGRMFLLAVVLVSASGCATRSYVDEKVTGLQSRLDEQATRIDQLTQTSQQALERARDAGVLAQGKFLYTVVLTQDGITFDTDQSTLSDTVQSQLTGFAGGLKSDNQNVYLEIQGYTDATGPAEYNQVLGWKRAEAVRRYLHAQGVALGRMATISYGEDMPAEPNDTPAGRAANRRVEIVVLK